MTSEQRGDAPCDANVGIAALVYLGHLLPGGRRARAWWTVLDECRYWGDTELEDFLRTARRVASAHRMVTDEDHRRARRAALDAIERAESPDERPTETSSGDAAGPPHDDPLGEAPPEPVEPSEVQVRPEGDPEGERRLLSYVLVAAGIVIAVAAMIGLATVEEPVPTPEVIDGSLDAAPVRDDSAAAPDPTGYDPSRLVDGRQATAVPQDVARPVAISIDAIDVDHPVEPVGLQPDGEMEVPEDVHEIGWYEPGVKPGELGSAVLAGHVDSSAQGPGAFYDLRHLEEGDLITVIDADGVERAWEVTHLVRYPKDEVPLGDLFRWEGDEPGLVLVTCGGEFDRTARSYVDNIVVYTTPVGD